VSVQAKDRPFYDSKSNIVGVSGAYDKLVEYGYGEKMFENPVKLKTVLSAPVNKKGYSDSQINSVLKSLNEENAGNMVLRYLFADGNQLSEKMVQQRALKNIQRGDIEFANANYKDANDVLRDDCLPILTHNYIYLEYRTDDRIAYMVFHVCIDKDVLEQVYATWNNIRGLDRIKVPVEFVATDVVKYNITKDPGYTTINRSLAKNAEAFAIRGQILQRNPAKIDANSQNGVKKGNLVSIYSQRMDKSGKLYSKRISRGRICGVNSKTSQLYFIAGNRGNRKNGDIAVVTRDKQMAVTIEGMWQPHCYAAQVGYDGQFGYSRAGFVSHFLSDLAFAMTDKPGENFNFEGLEPTYKSPVFFNIGIGYGLSKVFGGFIEVMPYFMAQYDIAIMFDKDFFKYDENDPDNNQSTDIMGCSIRIPVGLRLDINIAYPFQLTLTGGYAFNISLGDDETDLTMSYSSIQAACDYLGAKRDGLFFGAGFKIHF
jgi:hypothetical protein